MLLNVQMNPLIYHFVPIASCKPLEQLCPTHSTGLHAGQPSPFCGHPLPCAIVWWQVCPIKQPGPAPGSHLTLSNKQTSMCLIGNQDKRKAQCSAITPPLAPDTHTQLNLSLHVLHITWAYATWWLSGIIF